MGIEERRARLGVRHLLAAAARGRTTEDVTGGLLALHATDAASVYLSAAARLVDPQREDVARALYDDRSVVRMLGMRRTVFVLPAGLAPVVQAACTTDIARRERQQLVKHLAQFGHPEPVGDPGAWLADVGESAARLLGAKGPLSAQEVTAAEPRLRQKLLLNEGKAYEALVNVTGRVLTVLAAEDRIVRGRPRGSWQSTQYEWSATGAWLGAELDGWQPEVARVELARRWLRRFGPAPVDDLRWWTGWTVAQTRKALAGVDVVEVDLGGAPGVVLADDLEPTLRPEPWVALLPALDPTAMGWAERDWYLGPHRSALFDRNGNVGPTVWCDGRIVGGWVHRADGEVAFRLLEDVGAQARAAIGAEAARLADWLGAARVVPKFRTPLERELSG